MRQSEAVTQVNFQALWRTQLRLIGLFSFILVVIALVAGLYLSVSSQIAEVGSSVQSARNQIETLDQQIEHQRSMLAKMLSASEMDKRARTMGFERLQPERVRYLKVPGYAGRPTVHLAPYTPPTLASAPGIPVEYTESLFAWLQRQIAALSRVGGLP